MEKKQLSKVSDEQIKLMRENFREDFELLALISSFVFEISKAVKDFECDLDTFLKAKAALEDTDDLPM